MMNIIVILLFSLLDSEHVKGNGNPSGKCYPSTKKMKSPLTHPHQFSTLLKREQHQAHAVILRIL